jgi:hypothetical protein
MICSIRTILCLGLIAIGLSLIQPTLSGFEPTHAQVQSDSSTNIMLSDQEVGDNRSFWAYDFESNDYYFVNASLLAIGVYSLIYIEDCLISSLGETEAVNRADLYRDEFDTIIYPRVTDLAGHPNGTLGDIDGDLRIYILITNNPMSCYLQSNEIEAPHSNMCEMVYIYFYCYDVLETIAHEFDHLIWFNNEFDEVHFLLEGLAEYASFYAGYFPGHNLSIRAPYFINNIHDSLIYFEVESQDYGACYLFAFYLAEQYGVQFLRDLVHQTYDGALGLESALLESGFNITFNELYMDWMTALTINENGFADGRFYFGNIDATIQDYTAMSAVPFEDDISLYCYGSKVYRMAFPPDNFVVKMTQPGDEVAGISVAYSDSTGWHVEQKQNRGAATLSISGVSVNTAYVIVSHLFFDVPDGSMDFGPGPIESVKISMYASEGTTVSENMTSTTISSSEPSISESVSPTITKTITITSIPTSVARVADFLPIVIGGIALVVIVTFVIHRKLVLKPTG